MTFILLRWKLYAEREDETWKVEIPTSDSRTRSGAESRSVDYFRYPTTADDIEIVPSTAAIRDLATRSTESSDRQSRITDNLQKDLTAQAVLEGEALGDADDILDAQRHEFFQNRVNASNAVPPSYQDACNTLSLDPIKPHEYGKPTGTDNTTAKWHLLPHQVQAKIDEDDGAGHYEYQKAKSFLYLRSILYWHVLFLSR